MAFNNFPYTNFQDLNLGWILSKIKNSEDAKSIAESASTTANQASATANAASTTANQASTTANQASATANAASTTANQASSTANQASSTANQASSNAQQALTTAQQALNMVSNTDEILFIYQTNDNKAIDYVDFVNGTTTYISALNVYNAMLVDKRVPLFMDRNTCFFTLTGITTSPDNPLNLVSVEFGHTNANGAYTISIDRDSNVTRTFEPSEGGGGTGDFVLLRMNDNGQVYHGTTAITGTQINTLAATKKAVFLWDEDNERLYTYTEQGTSAGQLDGTAEFVSPLSNGNGCYLIVVNAANNNSTFYENNVPFQAPRVAMASTDTTPTLDPNKLYVFPEIATLTPTLATPSNNNIENEYHFIFNSGSTPTTLTLPNTIRQPDGFTVEANHVYEVSILENNMTAQGWAVTA